MTERKTVVFAIQFLGGGGAESHTLRILNYLDRSRFRPVLAVSALGGNYEPFLRKDVEVRKVSLGEFKSSTLKQIASAPGLRRLARELRPSIVFLVMDFMALVGIPALLSLGGSRPKVVPVVQIPPTIEYTRTRRGRVMMLPGIRALYPRADRVIALSYGARDDLASLDPRLADRTTVIHNACVDDRIDTPTSDDAVPETSSPVILGAGRLIEQKGFSYLVDAFAEVRKATPAELWIIGDGPDRSKLERQIARLDLTSSVKLLGFQSNPYAFMRRATIFCLSSIYEGFGNVVVEAMGCGTPVVSTDCPYGPLEVIRNEREGLLVPTRDPRALAASLLRVLSDDALRTRMREGGKERAQAFHARTIAAAYGDEIDRICGG